MFEPLHSCPQHKPVPTANLYPNRRFLPKEASVSMAHACNADSYSARHVSKPYAFSTLDPLLMACISGGAASLDNQCGCRPVGTPFIAICRALVTLFTSFHELGDINFK